MIRYFSTRELATYRDANIIELSELAVAPLSGQDVSFVFPGIQQRLDRVMHRRPWCKKDGNAATCQVVKPDERVTMVVYG